MDIFYKLPQDIARKIFRYFRHPVAELVKFHHRTPQIKNLMADLRDYPISLQKLYSLPHAKDHDGKWGRARLLNSLWIEAHAIFGDYYKIWERMYRVRCPKMAKWWIGYRYALYSHKFQINSLWALFTKEEREMYLQGYILT